MRATTKNIKSWEKYIHAKLMVLDHYGHIKCKRCPEDRLGAINLDHIYGEGNNHYNALGLSHGKHWQWIIDNKFPPIFQVLCSNCNTMKWIVQKDKNLNQWSSNAIRSREQRRRARQDAMALFGSQCCDCNNTLLDVLTVDHINHDGANHRDMVSHGRRGTSFYRWLLRQEKVPNDLACRCYNCNSVRAYQAITGH